MTKTELEKQVDDLWLFKLGGHVDPIIKARIAEWVEALIEQECLRARIDELESLDHEPQMHGDWQQVIEDRLAQLKSKENL